jgi:uncharacterized protein (DUF1800 family)
VAKNYKKLRAWDVEEAKHLLSRTTFGYKKSDIDFALSLSLEEFVENHVLSTNSPSPENPGVWINYDPPEANGEHNSIWLTQLSIWYQKQLLNTRFSFQERMILFLHNHFTTEARKSWQIQRIYAQHKLFRENVFGNLKTLTKAITIDSAMLEYLDGVRNTKYSVNENFSRELLELYTIGIGNYTQEDIKQGALALTGWCFKPTKMDVYLDPKKRYNGSIKYLNKEGNFSYDDVVEIIFQKPETSNCFCRKLCREIVSSNTPESFIEEASNVFAANNFELRNLLFFIFSSNYFYSSEVKASKIKSPYDFIVGTTKFLNIGLPNESYFYDFAIRLGQELFNPPDVRGWEGQRKWLNTATYTLRNTFIDCIIDNVDLEGNNLNSNFDIVQYARSFSSSEDAVKFIEEVTLFLLQYPLSQERKQLLLDILLDGNESVYWSTYAANAEINLKKFFKTVLKFEEFQLH